MDVEYEKLLVKFQLYLLDCRTLLENENIEEKSETSITMDSTEPFSVL